VALYHQFISDWAEKMSQLKLVTLGVAAARQIPGKQGGETELVAYTLDQVQSTLPISRLADQSFFFDLNRPQGGKRVFEDFDRKG